MDIQTLTAFFMWCTIINVALFAWAALWCILAPDFLYRMHGRLFHITRETFDAVLYAFLGAYKILILVFSLVPYLALLIVG